MFSSIFEPLLVKKLQSLSKCLCTFFLTRVMCVCIYAGQLQFCCWQREREEAGIKGGRIRRRRRTEKGKWHKQAESWTKKKCFDKIQGICLNISVGFGLRKLVQFSAIVRNFGLGYRLYKKIFYVLLYIPVLYDIFRTCNNFYVSS